MSEFSLKSTTPSKIDQFSSLLLSDFMLFCSLIFSHPLYFSYFIFFSPYLFKILSFLSPLFITTSLLLLALFTLLANDAKNLSESKASLILSTYHKLIESFKSDVEDDEFQCFVTLQVYEIVFETGELCPNGVKSEETLVGALNDTDVQIICLTNTGELNLNGANLEEILVGSCSDIDVQIVSLTETGELLLNGAKPEETLVGAYSNTDVQIVRLTETSENPDGERSDFKAIEANSQCPVTKTADVIAEGIKSFQEFLDEEEVYEDFPQTKEEKEVKFEKSGEQKEDNPIITKESKEEKVVIEHDSKAMLNSSWRERGDYYENERGTVDLGSFGSMRREKEWKRTLACKLFEERHTGDVGGDSGSEEGMDLLWETYEADTNKARSKKGNKGGHHKENSDEEDEDFESDGQFCCLQALKLSAGKMHLGMRTPNLMKITKALKGIGWLHQVSSRHGKKKGYRS